MTEKLSKEKIALFDSLIKSLSLALKNSALYPPSHPAFTYSIESFKDTLDKWLINENKLELGVSSDNIMLNGVFVKEAGDIYHDVADFLHKKGLIALLFTVGIDVTELLRLFSFLKNDASAISEKGGIVNNIGSMAHLEIKEADYSSLLTSAKTTFAMNEKDIWQSLSGIGKELKNGQLPKSKVEFMAGFLRDPKKAAVVLNKIYKEALAKIDRQSTAEEIRDVFSEMNKYFEKYSDGGGGETKKELADIMSNLDPDLVVSLFKDKAAEDGSPDLADELFKGFSNDMMAGFMASLMRNKDNVNEKMIKLFGRLVSGQDKADSVLPMMADKLFNQKLLSRDSLSALQGSIKDMFESHPEDDVINQIYNLTVGSFLDKGKGGKSGIEKYSELTNGYNEFLKTVNLKREKVRLLLNILWLENDAARFKKILNMLVISFKDIMDAEHIRTMKEVFELLAEKLSPNEIKDSAIVEAVKNALEKIFGEDTLDKIISFIPASDSEELDDIGYMIKNAKEHSDTRLLDIFMNAPDSVSRGKFGHVIAKAGGNIAIEIVSRIDFAINSQLFTVAIELYEILKTVDLKEAHIVAGRLMKSRHAQVRSRILEGYSPDSPEEKNIMLEVLGQENDAGVRKKLLTDLVGTKDGGTIKKLFERADRGFFKSRFSFDLVILCGTHKAESSLPYLKRTLERKLIINTNATRALRVQSVLSLARIGTPEAMAVIRASADDRDKSVRAMCKMVLESDKKANEKAI